MPRYPEHSPNYVASKKAIAERAAAIGGQRPARDFHEPKRRADLYAAAQGVLDFASGNEDLAVLTVINASLPWDAMERAMCAVEDSLTRLAPRLTDRPITLANIPAVYDLSDAIHALPHLREHHCGISTMRPNIAAWADDDGEPKSSTDWEPDWAPSDEATPEILTEMLPAVLDCTQGTDALADSRELVGRMAILAEAAIQELLARLTRDGPGGLSMPEIGRRVAASKGRKSERLKTIHERLVQEVGSLQDALLRGLTRVPDMLVIDVDSLGRAAETWCQECLPLLGVAGNTLESKRKVLRGAIANVVQYRFLIHGAVSLPGLLIARWGLRVVARTITRHLAALDPEVPQAASLRAKVRTQVAAEVEMAMGVETLAEGWRKRLGPDAKACGRFVDVVGRHNGHKTPWRLRDHMASLTHAKILDGKNPASRQRQMIRLLGRMQQIGIAFQVPWDYVCSRRKEPPRRPDGSINPTGTKWLLNPLASCLSGRA